MKISTSVLLSLFFGFPLSALAGGSADMSISNTASPSPGTALSSITYSMNVFNNGPLVVATGVTVTNTLPVGVAFISATWNRPGGVSTPCTGTTTIVCTIGTITVGGGVAVVVVVNPSSAGDLTDTATVAATEDDPDPSNNTAVAVNNVVPAINGPSMTDPNLSVRTVISGLTEPTTMAFLGPDDFLVLEKSTGTVKRVVNGVSLGSALTLAVNSAQERGLLGIALHPNFEKNGLVYLYWTCRGIAAGPDCQEGPPTPSIAQVPLLGNRVDRFQWDGSSLTFDQNLIRLRSFQADADEDGIFSQPLRANHNGGRIAFGPDGKLYILIGDNGRRGWMQNVTTGRLPNGHDDQFGGPDPDNAHLTGVILRLNDDGSTPEDNPFFKTGMTINGEVGANIQKVFGYGVRNSFGLAFDPISGNLFTEENGDDSNTELNLVEAGFNGGWVQIDGLLANIADYKAIETSPRYFGLQQVRWPPTLIADTPEEALARLFLLPGANYTDPLFTWKYEIAPAGIGFVNGDGLGSEYAGDLFVGAARDFLLGGQLWDFKLTDNRRDFVLLDPALQDRRADNFDKYDLTESESLLIGQGFGIATDIQTGPNGNVFVVSNSRGAVYEIFRNTNGASN